MVLLRSKILLGTAALVFMSYGSASAQGTTTTTTKDDNPPKQLLSRFKASYFSFWDGPGLDGFVGYTPNERGRPMEDGLSLFTLLSTSYRFSDRIGIDVQNRIQWIHTNGNQLRLQSPRLGISGIFVDAGEWQVAGAINSDVPYVGYIVKERTILFNPGMFASVSYVPRESKFSFFAILSPRFWIYGDRGAVEPQWINEGLRAGQKPEMVLSASPTLNYAISEKLGLRGGTVIELRKFVESSWTNWTRWRQPVLAGSTYRVSKRLEVFPYVQTFPFDGQGVSLKTSSLGMWLSGTIL